MGTDTSVYLLNYLELISRENTMLTHLYLPPTPLHRMKNIHPYERVKENHCEE
jgi:hypothetical protein